MYPGGKGNSYQKIINLIPPHRVYIETHLGGGSVLLNKRPARHSYALDIYPPAIQLVRFNIATNGDAPANIHFVVTDAVSWLLQYPFEGDEFIYADPPYVMSTRKQQRPLYNFEYTDTDHEEFLGVIRTIPCKIMISGYMSDIYQEILDGWNVTSYETMTRGNTWATEYLWMNYSTPTELHDYTHLGDNYRQRERIKRKKTRWANKLARMHRLERLAIMAAISESQRS